MSTKNGDYHQQQHSIINLIDCLSAKISDVAANAENEFLSAYRVHMLSIQSELKTLHDQVTKAEEELKDDGQVAKLEHEATWFRDESMRLKTNTESMVKDLQNMYSKFHALKEQCNFLSAQLKSVMKRNRVLESELELVLKEKSSNLKVDLLANSESGLKKNRSSRQAVYYQNNVRPDGAMKTKQMFRTYDSSNNSSMKPFQHIDT